MFPVGFILVALALYLADSAIKNRSPITTLRAIVSDPKNLRTTLASSAQSSPGDLGTLLNPSGPVLGDGVVTDRVLQYAIAQIGKPYVWGGTGPKGYDCSGLIYKAYESVGISIPRTTAGQILGGTRVAQKNLRPGDLVFPHPGHVMLYMGGGVCVEAAHTGTVLHYSPVYAFFTARRYV